MKILRVVTGEALIEGRGRTRGVGWGWEGGWVGGAPGGWVRGLEEFVLDIMVLPKPTTNQNLSSF